MLFQIIGASVEIYSEDECFKGMFSQDLQMKQAFHAYPEVILIDSVLVSEQWQHPMRAEVNQIENL